MQLDTSFHDVSVVQRRDTGRELVAVDPCDDILTSEHALQNLRSVKQHLNGNGVVEIVGDCLEVVEVNEEQRVTLRLSSEDTPNDPPEPRVVRNAREGIDVLLAIQCIRQGDEMYWFRLDLTVGSVLRCRCPIS